MTFLLLLAGGLGVVLSVHIQLHPYPGRLETLTFLEPGSDCPKKDEFLLKYLLDSENSFGISESNSSKCGTTIPYRSRQATAFCFGQDSGRLLRDTYLNYTQDVVLPQNCPLFWNEDFPGFPDQDYLSVGEALNAIDLPEPTLNNLYGFEPESIGDGLAGQLNAVIPKEWIVNNIDKAIEMGFVPVYMAFGSTAEKAASDQLDSVAPAYRDGGNMVFLDETGSTGSSSTVETFIDLFPEMYDLSDPTLKLPSHIGSNHYKGKSV